MLASTRELQEQQQERFTKIEQELYTDQPKVTEALEQKLRDEILTATRELQEQQQERFTKIEQELYTDQPKVTEALEQKFRGEILSVTGNYRSNNRKDYEDRARTLHR